ncbi:MAG: hypothetical protein U9R27_08590 [Campylobacterota bacterium]|nr:hypothetical protein [Campylobacterota bacterium]
MECSVVLWFCLISVSTLLVHQHHLADLFLGSFIVLLLNYYIKEEKDD